MRKSMTRRECVSALAALGVSAAVPKAALAAAPARGMKFGVQLHGIRGVCARDIRGALAAVKAMGYEGIEAGSFFGLSPKDFGAAVRDAGLELVALQFYPHLFTEPQLRETIRLCRECGAKRLSSAWFKGSAENFNDWQLVVNVLKHAAQVCKDEGIAVSYHNHDQEFAMRLGGEVAMDWLAKRLSPDVDLEFDPGWCVVAGGDAAAWLAAHPHRNPTVHLTPAIADGSGLAPGEAGLGSPRDKVDWRTLIPALEKDGVRWAFAKPLTHPDSLADLEASVTDIIRLTEFRI